MDILFSVLLALVISVSSGGYQDIRTDPQSQPEAVKSAVISSKVSYLGPEGTYTQEACQVFFGKQGTYLPYTTVEEAVQALSDGECGYAVIPQENTIGGAVVDYVDILTAHTEVSVVGEVEQPINQNLLILPGTSLDGIKTVYSHKQGIAQGKEWLEKNLPDAEIVEVSSTAEGARIVSEGNDPSCAAIASAVCADVYSLDIAVAGIQNNDSNKTRFYVLSLKSLRSYHQTALHSSHRVPRKNCPLLWLIWKRMK